MQRLLMSHESATSMMNIGRRKGNGWGTCLECRKKKHIYAGLRWSPSGQGEIGVGKPRLIWNRMIEKENAEVHSTP